MYFRARIYEEIRLADGFHSSVDGTGNDHAHP
jgi:hypothetical protein